MSKLKKLKEMSTIKKLLIAILLVAVVTGAVFLIIHFCFPDADTDYGQKVCYELTADKQIEEKVNPKLMQFVEKTPEIGSSPYVLVNVHTALKDEVSANSNEYQSLFYMTDSIKDVEKLNKKNKQLKKLKASLDKAEEEVMTYYQNHLETFDLSSVSSKDVVNSYYSNLASRYTKYLNEVNSVNEFLFNMVQKCSTETTYCNDLTILAYDFSHCSVKAALSVCTQKYVEDKDVAVSSSFINKDFFEAPTNTFVFELKDDAINEFLKNSTAVKTQIGQINNYSWLDDWLKLYNTSSEKSYLDTLTEAQAAQYSTLKTFVEKYFDVSLISNKEVA